MISKGLHVLMNREVTAWRVTLQLGSLDLNIHTYIYYFKYQDPKKPTITRKWSCKSLLQFVTL